MPKHLIIDTNLLVLLVIGAVEEGIHIRNSKRLNAFDISDYDKVLNIMDDYDDVFITPYGVLSDKTHLRVNEESYFFGLGFLGFGHVASLS